MKDFLHDDFLLDTKAARRLYHGYAAAMPILDYHSHLSPQELADNAGFDNLAQLWLSGDHYKWRLMRAAGIPESQITGHAADERSFMAWAKALPKALGNPVYHWTHLELRRYFGVKELLNQESAPRIWQHCNELLKTPEFKVQGLLKTMKVQALCTTDDPADSLEHHLRHRGSPRMAPTFRPDKALAVRQSWWPDYLKTLGAAAGIEINSYERLIAALAARHDFFHQAGCRLSDHALLTPLAIDPSRYRLESIFTSLLGAQPVGDDEAEAIQTALLLEIGRLNREKDWAMQLHCGALRNINSRQFASLGPDSGFDAIGGQPIAAKLAGLLNLLNANDALPKTILYSLNPIDYASLATVMGGFQSGDRPGKMQLGSAWWFNDHIDGMRDQLRTFGNYGLLSGFVGMLTDSRSWLSFPRHEYFRRVLCGFLGQQMEAGLLPGDLALLGAMVRDICYNNAHNYFGLKVN